MSNSTSTSVPPISSTPLSSPETSRPSSSPTANPDTSTAVPDTSSPFSSTPPTTSIPPPTSSNDPTTSAPPPTTQSEPSTSPPEESTSAPPPTTSTPPKVVTTVITPTGGGTSVVTSFITTTPDPTTDTSSHSTAPTSTSSSSLVGPSKGDSKGLNESSKIAIGVVVPIAAVALLVLAGIFFWRKRKARKEAEEQRRKEVEDYTYNPNADPTIPAVGGAAAGAYEMKEDGSSGYRGWGSTTAAGSTGRKASTTMSGGATGVAYSDATSPTRAGMTDSRSGEAVISEDGHSPEGEILGAMGPAAADNRGANVARGPSNASSSYSAGGRSDGSGEGGIGVAYSNPEYYNQYGSNNPYAENNGGQRPSELGGAPVIRDNPARRNTRIENPAHHPQNAGISQNF